MAGTTWLTFIRIHWRLTPSSELVEIVKTIRGWDKDDRAVIKIGDNEGDYMKSPYTIEEHKIVTSGKRVIYLYLGVQNTTASPPTDYKVMLKFTRHTFAVTLDCEYMGKVCGLLGNFNGDPDDDWVDGDTGEILTKPVSPNENMPWLDPVMWEATWRFGNTWLVPEQTDCDADLFQDFMECTPGENAVITSNDLCGMFRGGTVRYIGRIWNLYRIF